MKIVYVVEGWFGDDEWTERIFENQVDADAYCAELWINREARDGQRHICSDYQLCKFAVLEREVY